MPEQTTVAETGDQFIEDTDEQFQTLWERYAPLLKKSLDRTADGAWEVDDVKAEVMAGRMQFWPMEHSVVVTEILSFPRKKALNCMLCGGRLDELRTIYASLEAFARANGCYAIYGSGRKGWWRVMRTFGWQPDYHVWKVLET